MSTKVYTPVQEGVAAAYTDAVRLLRLPEVKFKTGLCRSEIYRRCDPRDGTFPRPIRLSSRSIAWPSNEVAAWIAAKVCGAKDEVNRPGFPGDRRA